jgi:hypothetical protein
MRRAMGYRLIGAEENLQVLNDAVARFEQHFDRLRPKGLEGRDDDAHATPASHGGHPLVRLDADDFTAAIEEELRRDAGTATDVQHTSHVPVTASCIHSGGRIRRPSAVVLLSVLTEREAALVVHVCDVRSQLATATSLRDRHGTTSGVGEVRLPHTARLADT